MFIVSLNYVKDLTDIEAHLSDHVAYLDRYYRQGVFLMSWRKQPRTGGIIVMQAESVEQVERIISEDPFHRAKVAEYQIIEFIPTKTSEDLAQYRKTL